MAEPSRSAAILPLNRVAREQPIDFAAMPYEQQLQRCQDIDALDYLVDRYGLAAVQIWIDTASPGLGVLRERYDSATLSRWLRYFSYRDGRRH